MIHLKIINCRIVTITLVLICCGFPGFSQHITYSLRPMVLDDLEAFSSPARHWKIVGGLQGSFSDEWPKDTEGTGILFNDFTRKDFNKETANLSTNLEHADLVIALDFLLPRGSSSGILLQGRYEIQLADSWGVKLPRFSDTGGIDQRWDNTRTEGQKGYQGHAPNTNASLAPNLWQHLEIEFQAARFDESGKKNQPAKIVRLSLNGIVLHEHVVLHGPTKASIFNDEQPRGPLIFQGGEGPVAFKNIQYALLNDFKVGVSDIYYEYYEGKFKTDFAQVKPDDLVRSGKTELIDMTLVDNPNDMMIQFEGKIHLKDSTTYQFFLRRYCNATLSVDGKEIISSGENFALVKATKVLDKGAHTFTLKAIRNFTWGPSGLGLYIGKDNARPMPLHHHASLPNLAPEPLIPVKVGQEPEPHRSFMMHEGILKTQVISVGGPNGVHFSYDLDQAVPLMLWRGAFLNATDMWYERGEPQTAAVMGAAISLNNYSPFSVGNPEEALPDTLNPDQELIYKGYLLNSQRQPEFHYVLNGLAFTDLLTPDATGRGLSRILRFKEPSQGKRVLVRLAAGAAITKVADHTYAINNQQYYIQLEASDKLKPEVMDGKNGKELVVRLKPGVSDMKYNFLW